MKFYYFLFTVIILLGCNEPKVEATANNSNESVIKASGSKYSMYFGVLDKPQDLDERQELGKLLFHDKRLSKGNQIACVSCHNVSENGADNKPVSLGVNNKVGNANAPTVFNSKYNFKQFWDGRAADLFDQIDGPVHNPIEMGSNWEEIISKLEQDEALVKTFSSLFEEGLTSSTIKLCISEYEQTLVTPSRFDFYLENPKQNPLSKEEIEGLELFISAGCVSCHQGVNVGGNMFQKLGVVQDYFEGKEVKTIDLGKFNVTGNELDKYYFKVPSLRNVEITAPYFHDGSISTLEEAVKTMFQYQLGVTPNAQDVESIIMFLKTLTDASKK